MRSAQAEQEPWFGPQRCGTDQAVLPGRAQHQPEVEHADSGLEGRAEPIYHRVRRPYLRQLKSVPFTQKFGHALPSLKLKQAPPSPPALIQQHLIAGEPQFQSCAPMDKRGRVGYGQHRRNTQPAKSARYWNASTCFTRWMFINIWPTSQISFCAATRADWFPDRHLPGPRSRSPRALWKSPAFFGIACSPPQTS